MEEKNSSVKKNIAYDTFYRIVATITPFITAPYIARVIGAEGIGIQSYTQSIQSYFIMFASLGTAIYGSREIARNRDDVRERSKLFWEIEFLCIITTAICFLLFIPLILFSRLYSQIYLVLSFGILGVALDISWFYVGLEKFKSIVTRNTIVKIVELILLFTFVKSSDDLLIYISITVFSLFFSYISYWPGLKKLLAPISLKKIRVFRHLRGVIVFFVPSIASSIYVMLDKPLLGWITKDNYEIGYYQQAQKFIDVLKSLVYVSINSVVGVRMSNLYAKGKMEEIKNQFSLSMNYIFFMGIGAAFGLCAVASNLVPLFYGPGYDRVIPLIYLFSPIVVIIGVSNCLELQYFTPCGRRSESIRYLIVGASVNLVFNLVLIPKFKAYGATVSTLLAETIVTIQYVKNSKSFLRYSFFFKTSWKKLVAGLIMFLAIYPLKNLKLNVVFVILTQVICGVVLYCTVLFILRDEWTIQESKDLFKKVRNLLKR